MGITKIAGDEPSDKGRVLKVHAKAWRPEEDLFVLRDAIANYRDKQRCIRRKKKIIRGVEVKTGEGLRWNRVKAPF